MSAWLITICRNKFLDSVKKSTEQQFTNTTDDTKLVSDNLSDNVEVKKIFEDCSQQLDENKKDVLFMSYIKGITTKEISDIIQKPQNTILTWLANAKKQMIECIEG